MTCTSNVRLSMGGRCDCCQDVLAENINGILKGAFLIYKKQKITLES